MPYPIIPETIVVHLGSPDSAAENITVPFAYYIKNVASNELYPTWPENAIRANMLAQISYALNRVYTEYYRSRGYDFDITNTTQYDQAYVQGGDIYDNISRIADQIFNDYIVRQGNIEPLFAQFCDGVQTQCQGLSQWGSVELANQGMIPYEILQYYYGDNINIVFDAPVSAGIPSYPGVPLRRGSANEEVRILRRELNRIGKNYPAIPAIPGDSAIFDAATEAAVREFQQIFNLTVDGIVGKATWYKIKEVYNGVKGLSELLGEGLTLSEAQRVFPRTLGVGDTGSGVQVLQYYLAFLGFFYPDLPQIPVTGTFDENTRDAVLTFQNVYGLKVDGIVGRETWNRIQDLYKETLSNLPEQYRAYADEIYPGYVLVVGDTGNAVTQLQENLCRISQADPSIPSVTVSGEYDETTKNAVRALQRQLGYEETGAVGPITWQAIITRGRNL